MEQTYRTVTFLKSDIVYTAQVWPIEPNTAYKARVILLHNQGEDIELYKRIIKCLSACGYESFFYQRMYAYESNDQVRREMNRVVKMCIDDIDQNTERNNHKIHLLSQFISASKALDYGIDGFFNYRLKSIIAINPHIYPTRRNPIKWFYTLLYSKVSPTRKHHNFSNFTISDMTTDQYWQTILNSSNYNYDNLCAKEASTIYSISDKLVSKKSISKFMVKNVLIVKSEEDQLSKIDYLKFIIKNLPIETSSLIEYKNGKNNLILEKQDIFNKFVTDLLSWLDKN